MGKLRDEGASSASDASAACSPTTMGEYAPSPNTCSQALTRANQLRVQALLRQLIQVNKPPLAAGIGASSGDLGRRLDTLRVLRRTMRELDYHLSWLTQVDFFETLELVLRNEKNEDADGRLVHDATQLLIESIPRVAHELEPQSVAAIFASVVQNLGHARSEVRRASLLLINMYLNERPAHFQLLLRLFIDYGLANHRNQQAQRGAILSLPLLMTEQTVANEDLLPLVRCLSELLLDANPQLFYSLYLALQRLHMTVGDQQFAAYLRQCNPEATLLYKQATSRHTSFDLQSSPAPTMVNDGPIADRTPSSPPLVEQQSSAGVREDVLEARGGAGSSHEQGKQVTFETDLVAAEQQHDADVEESSKGSSVVLKQQAADRSLDNRELASGVEPQFAATDEREDDDDDDYEDDDAATIGDGFSFDESERSDQSARRRTPKETRSKVRSKTTGPVRPRSLHDSSSVSSTCSSEANLVDPAHYMNAAALNGRPLTDFERIHHLDHSATGLSINDLCVSCTPTQELGPGAENELKFGIFPRHLIDSALDTSGGGGARRHLDRLQALEELMCIARDSPVNHLAILMTYFDSFLHQFLARLLLPAASSSGAPAGGAACGDYRVALIAIDMIETIVIKTKVSTMQYVRPLVGLLVKSIAAAAAAADGRHSVLRENSVRVIHKMMAFLPPQYVIDAIFEHKHSRCALVRHEATDRVTAAVLHYDKNEFNLTKLCYHVLPMLADQQASVRLAALECIAALAHALGPERIGSLLTAAEAVQTGCDYDGLLDAIHARIMRRALPRVNPDGSVRYVIKPFLSAANASFHQEHQAADVRWVLEAPSRHQHPHPQQPQSMLLADASGDEPPAERPGHYDPQVAASMRRRSVANLLIGSGDKSELESPTRHLHHHQPNHQSSKQEHQAGQQPSGSSGTAHQNQSAGSSGARRGNEPSASGSTDCNATGPLAPSAGTQRQEPQTATGGGGGGTGNASEIENKRRPLQEARGDRADGASGATRRRQQQQQSDRREAARASQPRGMRARSCSQDSISSTDTNKVLFQYYLGKFKQSLAETATNGIMYSAALPSDSIIYTDVVQAYELSRHQSRYQQTSFDYEADSVGRVPAATIEPEQEDDLVSLKRQQQQQQARKQSLAAANRKKTSLAGHATGGGGAGSSSGESRSCVSVSAEQRVHQARGGGGDTSGSESPETVMESTRQQAELLDGRESELESADVQSARRLQRSSREASGEEDSAKRTSGDQGNDETNGGEIQEERRRSSGGNARRKSVSRQQEPESARRKSSGASSSEHGSKRQSRQGSRSGSLAQVSSAPTTRSEDPSAGITNGEEDQQVQQQQQQQSEAEESAAAGVSTPLRGRQKAGLVRQSASAAAEAESEFRDGEDLVEEGRRGEAADDATGSSSGTFFAGDQHLQSAASSKSRPSGAETSASFGRQESTSTASDSRECSDHATQTTPQPPSERASRRRRSSRHRQLEHEQQADASDPNNDEDELAADEELAAAMASSSSERELRRRASRSEPPPAAAATTSKSNPNPSGRHQRQMTKTPSRLDLHQQQQDRAAALDLRRSVSVSPSVATSVNIRHILENVAESEGPFQEPQLAYRVAMEALAGPCWSTKVEGILALIRLAAHHQSLVGAHLHELVARVACETRNLRSTVARSAIFALGDLCARLGRAAEPEMDTIVQALLHKSMENTAFIRDDIRRALTTLAEHLTQWRLASSLIAHGAAHKNMHVRRMASQFVALLAGRMGPAKCLVGARDISAQLIPAAAKFAQDGSPHTRYYGRLIISKIMQHSAFERLARKNLAPNLYRSTIGIIESVKRRGPGEPPADA